jgi:DNA-binding CsgD family transcriptional regulator
MIAQIDTDQIKLLAHRATRSAQSRFGSFDLPEHDYWDMRQEAAIAVWKAFRAGKNDAYAFAAGRNAAIGWQRQWRGMKSHRTGELAPPTFYAKSIHDEREAYSIGVVDDSCILSDELVEELFEMILHTRRAKGQKEIDGAVRAANIMRLIAAGYNNLGIAQEMQMTYYNVRNYRRQIQITLKAIARAGGVA